jgi:putative PIN family toxin of toxin-antitoxin system
VRIVLDTNVIVSGLLDDSSPPAQVLDLCLSGNVDLVLDERILAAYREVLRRPRLKLDARDVDQLMDAMRYAVHVVGVPLPFALPDPDDRPFLECAVAGAVDALVTGNTKHFRLREGKLDIPILTPRQFLNRLSSG